MEEDRVFFIYYGFQTVLKYNGNLFNTAADNYRYPM